ncbi:MAG: hypothetical protein E4H13_03450 [Calditrichales bacterium]|nr:MAG: hypothetical protein E4H13_03450 [Calditrichales bacterium]
MKRLFSPVLLLFFCLSPVFPNTLCSVSDSIHAHRATSAILVDGILNETVWSQKEGISNFTQRNPNEGQPATFKTEVHIFYDDEALYIGARMHDPSPDSIIARLGRKDDLIKADAFYMFIDPYNDKRSGYYFALNAAGTFYDGVMYNDEWNDNSWDGIWEGKVSINESGWTAEMRIPYSQISFVKTDQTIWGINFNRDIARINEEDFLVFTPKDGSGFVSRFPSLVGLENISPTGSVELLPYTTARAEKLSAGQNDPYHEGTKIFNDIGGDFKWKLGSDLTVNGTINADFGQVEVDPAVVNLGDVETYFSEKRPFFVEGSSIYQFGNGGSRSNWSFNWSNPSFFYSRRVGRTPQGSLPDHDYADVPNGVRLLGAAKLTGRIGADWNIGMIHAVTDREYGRYQSDGKQYESEVEPLSYYGVFRAQKEIDQGRQGIGLISTASKRYFKDDLLRDQIGSDAYTLGLDGWTFLDKDEMWVVTGWWGMSHVMGNPTYMSALQQNSRHYFQRPDATHLSVDTLATSMTGLSGRISINKQKGNVIFNSALGFIDPKFEINDLGFIWRTDVINSHIGGGYRWTEIGDYARYLRVMASVFGSMDFEKNLTWYGYWANYYIQFLNYYELDISYAYNPQTVSNRLTRGGPLSLNPLGWELNAQLTTDSRKNLVFTLSTNGYSRGRLDWDRSVHATIKWKPSDRVSLQFSPGFLYNRGFAQWVTSATDIPAVETYGQRYIFSEFEQKEISASIRLDWIFTPKLSFQLFVQPLISSADYYHFKYLARSKSYDFTNYGQDGSTVETDGGTYWLDADGSDGPAQRIEVSNPDFNYKSLRANAVLRWEYLPGSVFYLVWTHNRADSETDGRFRLNNSIERMLATDSDNIIMAKLTYWMNL